MVNESLEILIQNTGIISDSKTAKLLRERLGFLSIITQSDFNFVLKKINNQERTEDKNSRAINKEAHSKSEKQTILEYVEAKNYVMKEVPDLDETIIIVNADCIEKKAIFFMSHLL